MNDAGRGTTQTVLIEVQTMYADPVQARDAVQRDVDDMRVRGAHIIDVRPTTSLGWTAVDLDGTVAEYTHWQGPEHIGPPVPAMLERIRVWLADGRDVRIFTARVGPGQPEEQRVVSRRAIAAWTREHFGVELLATATKDYGMIALWDDRAVQVVPNTGMPIEQVQPA